MTAHDGHDHPNTAKARAACRRRDLLKAAIKQVAADPKKAVEDGNRKLAYWMITEDSAIVPDDAEVTNGNCTGPNPTCRKAHKQGRSVHVIADSVRMRTILNKGGQRPSLVMPTNHYTTAEEGLNAVREGWKNAIVITTDEELYEARRLRRPYILLPGWVDPTRRPEAASWNWMIGPDAK